MVAAVVKPKTSWVTHLSPVFGIAAGTLIAWFLAYCLDLLDSASELQQAVRLFGVITSVVMWALFTSAMQGKEMFGGGLFPLDQTCDESVRRTWLIRLIVLVAWGAAIMTLCTHKLELYWLIAGLLLVIVVGEVGWKDPFFGLFTLLKGELNERR